MLHETKRVTSLPAVAHRDDCNDPSNVTSTMRDGLPFVKCWSCRRFAWDKQPQPDPAATSVNWTALVAICERRGVPVLRVDQHGDTHIIRTNKQLNDWKNR